MSHVHHSINRGIDELVSIEIPFAIRRSNNGIIVFNSPGMTSTVDGHLNMNRNLAQYIEDSRIGAVVLTDCIFHYPMRSQKDLIDNFKTVIDNVLECSQYVCGSDNPTIYLMGYSAGGGVAAAVSADYPEVKKLLMLAPAANCGSENIKKGLNAFKGEVYCVVPGEDKVVFDTGVKYFDWVTTEQNKQLVMVPGCDHCFTREEYQKVFTKATRWAFLGDKTFVARDGWPDPEGGALIYDKQ